MKLTVRKTGINGEGIGYLQRKPVFVPGVLEQEVADVTITETRPGYYLAVSNRIISKSSERVQPVCRHQKDCGSCPMMIQSYRQQLKVKRDLLAEALVKYADYHGRIGDCVPSDEQLGYRNKINMPFVEDHGKLVNVLYLRGSNHPVIIENCPIHDSRLEQIRKQILTILNDEKASVYSSRSKTGYRQLVMRMLDGHCQIALVTGNYQISKAVVNRIAEIPEVESIYQGINTVRNPVNLLPDELKLLYGREKIDFSFHGLQLKIAMQAFFQLNRLQGFRIYERVSELVEEGCNHLVEAYCGIGIMSLYLSRKALKVTGIELNPQAVADAKENCRINGIENVNFICGDSSQQIIKLSRSQPIDVLVVDPPRTGLDDSLIENLLQHPVKKIIYVSCNPATLAKNIRALKKQYLVEEVTPYDMFPQTPNIESITVLRSVQRASSLSGRRRK